MFRNKHLNWNRNGFDCFNQCSFEVLTPPYSFCLNAAVKNPEIVEAQIWRVQWCGSEEFSGCCIGMSRSDAIFCLCLVPLSKTPRWGCSSYLKFHLDCPLLLSRWGFKSRRKWRVLSEIHRARFWVSFRCPWSAKLPQSFCRMECCRSDVQASGYQVRMIQETSSIMFCTTAIFAFVTAVAGLPLRGTSLYSFAGMHVAIEARDWCMERWMVPGVVYNDDQLMLHAVPTKQPLDLLHDSDCCQTKSTKMITPVWWTVIMKSAYSGCKKLMNITFMWCMKNVRWLQVLLELDNFVELSKLFGFLKFPFVIPMGHASVENLIV